MTYRSPSVRARRTLAISATTLLLGGSFAYATGAVGAPSPPDRGAVNGITLVDNDGDQPLFSLANMGPGQSATNCIAVTNESAVPVDVELHAADTGNLGGLLDLVVERGTAASPESRSCAGFTRDAEVWRGVLAEFPVAGEPGVGDGSLGAGATRVYRYTASLRDDNAAQGRTSMVSFGFSGTGEPPVAPPPPPPPAPTPTPEPGLTPPPSEDLILIETKPGELCTTWYIDSGLVKMHRRLRKGGRALLAIRKIKTKSGERLYFRMSRKLRTRGGSNARWAHVTLKANRKRIAASRTRPFRLLSRLNAIRTGPNKFQVLVRDRARKRSSVTFSAVVMKAHLKGTTVCVFRAKSKAGVRREGKR